MDRLAWLRNMSEEELLARTLMGEAGNEPFEGKVAAASVIRNRALAEGYPNTIRDNILAKGQFSLYNDITGHAGGQGANDVWMSQPDEESIAAARAVLSGAPDPTGGATHYFNPKAADPSWARGKPYQQIGQHRFLRADGGAASPDYSNMAANAHRDYAAQRGKSAELTFGDIMKLREDMAYSASMTARVMMPHEAAMAEQIAAEAEERELTPDPIQLPIPPEAMVAGAGGDQQIMGGEGGDTLAPENMGPAVEQARLSFGAGRNGPYIDPGIQDGQTVARQSSKTLPPKVEAEPTPAAAESQGNWFDRNRRNMMVLGRGLSSLSDPAPANIAGAVEDYYKMQELDSRPVGMPDMSGTMQERVAGQLMRQHGLPYEQAIMAAGNMINPPTAPTAKAPTSTQYKAAAARESLIKEGFDNPTPGQIGLRMEELGTAEGDNAPNSFQGQLAEAQIAAKVAAAEAAGEPMTPLQIAELRAEEYQNAALEVSGTDEQRLMSEVEGAYPGADPGQQRAIAALWADPQGAVTSRGKEVIADALLQNPQIAEVFDKDGLMALPADRLSEMSKNVLEPGMLDTFKEESAVAREQAKANKLAEVYADDAKIAEAYRTGSIEAGDAVRERQWEQGDRARSEREQQEFNAVMSDLLPAGPARNALLAAKTPEQRKAVLDQYADQVKTPNSFDEYELARKDPAYAAFLDEQRAATRPVLSAGEQAMADATSARMEQWAIDRNKRDRFQQSLEAARNILLTEGYEGGPVTANIRVPLQRIADDVFGKGVIEFVGDGTEALGRLIDALRGTEFQTMRETGSGATSDMESLNLLKGFPATTDSLLAALATTQFQLKLAATRNREHDLRTQFMLENPDDFANMGKMEAYVDANMNREFIAFERADDADALTALVEQGKVKEGDVINVGGRLVIYR